MNEKNELNDIILNRGNSTSSNKKIVLAVATLGVILIIVVMLMSTLTPDAKENLPQPIPLPQEEVTTVEKPQEEPLFEEVEVVQENTNDNLDQIAQRLKQQSQDSKETTKSVESKKEDVKVLTKEEPVAKQESKEQTPVASDKDAYFVQVGSFSKYAPNKKFLDSILAQGYRYKFHKVTKGSTTLNKVLVGPFYTEKEARAALRTIRSNIEAGAFLTKL